MRLSDLTIEEALTRQYISASGRLSKDVYKLKDTSHHNLYHASTSELLIIFWHRPSGKSNNKVPHYVVLDIKNGRNITVQPRFITE